MAGRGRRNEGKGPGKAPTPDGRRRARAAAGQLSDTALRRPASDWVWGWHAMLAALANPQRGAPRRLVATAERARELAARRLTSPSPRSWRAAAIAQLLPQGAIHQGVAMKAAPLEPLALAELASPAAGVLVMLDHVTDPQNVGAIFRSAAAFGARGVIVQDRHAPAFTGVLAKAAAGALDAIPHARVVNLARALDELDDLGWRAVGLAGEAAESLDRVLDGAADGAGAGLRGRGPAAAGGRTLRRPGPDPDAGRVREPERLGRRRGRALRGHAAEALRRHAGTSPLVFHRCFKPNLSR